MSEISNVDDLLKSSFSELEKVSFLGKRLERDRDTKIVLAQICLVAENGEAVYQIWSTEKSKELLYILRENLRKANLNISDDFINNLAGTLGYTFCEKIEEKRSYE